MGQAAAVVDLVYERETGDALIRALAADGFPIDVAFWAQADEDGQRHLYVATPAYDRDGPRGAYSAVVAAVRRPGSPTLWADSFDIKLISPADPMARAARSVVTPQSPSGPFAVPNPRPLPTMTRFNGPSLGGASLEGPAYIFPPYPPGLATP